ncbi:MAG: hypothetical protein ACI9R3_002951 [Verrucomicrobiales bacterium]|jgi:hypothetical protein
MSITQTFALIPLSDPRRGGIDLFDLDAAAEASGMHPQMIREFLRAGVVNAACQSGDGTFFFDWHGICRIRHIELLRRNRRVSLHMVCVIVKLLDRAETAEEELRRLRELVR